MSKTAKIASGVLAAAFVVMFLSFIGHFVADAIAIIGMFVGFIITVMVAAYLLGLGYYKLKEAWM